MVSVPSGDQTPFCLPVGCHLSIIHDTQNYDTSAKWNVDHFFFKLMGGQRLAYILERTEYHEGKMVFRRFDVWQQSVFLARMRAANYLG